MRLALTLIATIAFSMAAAAQVTEGIAIGDSYGSVLSRIFKDPDFGRYDVFKSKNRIVVSFKTDSSQPHQSIPAVIEYQFRENVLSGLFNVRSGNVAAVMDSLKQAYTSGYASPPEFVTKNGIIMLSWSRPGEQRYLYKAYSEWFEKECLYDGVAK